MRKSTVRGPRRTLWASLWDWWSSVQIRPPRPPTERETGSRVRKLAGMLAVTEARGWCALGYDPGPFRLWRRVGMRKLIPILGSEHCSAGLVRLGWVWCMRAVHGRATRGAGGGDPLSTDGHGFEMRSDPRFRTRQAAADAQRPFNPDRAATDADQARERDRLAADHDKIVDRALTAARRARS